MDYVGNPAFTATREVRDGMLYHEHLTLYRTP
ncbi:Atu4866 domain-containing protein [Streptomyces sp. NPDC059862]